MACMSTLARCGAECEHVLNNAVEQFANDETPVRDKDIDRPEFADPKSIEGWKRLFR